MPKCPGQDMRYWKPEDIFDVECPYCNVKIEFWKDEPFRMCKACGKEVRNPRIDLGCAKWCKFANECLGKMPLQQAAAPVTEKLIVILSRKIGSDVATLKTIDCTRSLSSDLADGQLGEPAVIISAALLAISQRLELIQEQRQEDVIPGTILQLELTLQQILREAGLDEDATSEVIKLVAAVNAQSKSEHKEFEIVSDIYKIILEIVINKIPLKDFNLSSLYTHQAQDYIKYRSGDLYEKINKG